MNHPSFLLPTLSAPQIISYCIYNIITHPPLPCLNAPLQGKKEPIVLTSGKDIKAQQFTVGLAEKQGFKVAIGFTKTNELFVSRMAMLGIASSIIGGKHTRCCYRLHSPALAAFYLSAFKLIYQSIYKDFLRTTAQF